jgi:hypothetical protein
MNDTAPEIAHEVQARLMRLPGSTRFAMGTQMFDSARAMIIASLPKDLTEQEFKRHLYERIYGETLPF